MDWQNLFTIMRFRYIKVLFHIILPLLGVKKLFTEDFARVSISTHDGQNVSATLLGEVGSLLELEIK